eukprot:SAG11_NODE_234_length_11857_cov_15.265776_3_plen_125_part_00
MVPVNRYSVGDVVVWDDRHCFHSTSPIKEKEERYGSGGVVGRRIIQRVDSSFAAAYKWGSTEDSDDEDEDENDNNNNGDGGDEDNEGGDGDNEDKSEDEDEAVVEKPGTAPVDGSSASSRSNTP